MRKIFQLIIILLMMTSSAGAVTIEDAQSPFHKTIFYPLVRMEDKNLEKKINMNIIAEIDRFVTETYNYSRVNDAEIGDIRSIYEIPCNEAGGTVILSVVIQESSYFQGAAHPLTVCRAININVANGEPIDTSYLTDVGAGIDINQFIDKLSRILQEKVERGEIYLFENALPLKNLPENFYWDENLHVHFIFNPYEIAPYAAGIIDLDIDD